MIYTKKYPSPLGEITLAAEDQALLGLWIQGQKYFLGKLGKDCEERKEEPILQQTAAWLDEYFQGKRPEISGLNLNPRGSGFAKSVWEILKTIPYGQTMTYGEIARRLEKERGTPMSAQAVGGAVGHNPISIIVPCHRVVGSSGSLTGYAGGLDKKIFLLTHEGVNMEKFFLPKRGTAL